MYRATLTLIFLIAGCAATHEPLKDRLARYEGMPISVVQAKFGSPTQRNLDVTGSGTVVFDEKKAKPEPDGSYREADWCFVEVKNDKFIKVLGCMGSFVHP